MKKYRLGIDLGTASLAVVAMELDNAQPVKPLWWAVRIFQEPLENNKEQLKPKKAKRREARLQRRQIQRRARRLRRIAHLAPLLGLDAATIKPHPGNGFSALRARAAREKVELSELLQISLRLAKKRGYNGEFKVKANKDSGEVKSGANELQKKMAELARKRGQDSVTLGEYLHYRISEAQLPGRLKLGPNNTDNLYALREMVEDEFEQIWERQAKYHPVLNNKDIKSQFAEAIFFQRPLKSPSAMVGNCTLEPTLPRSPKAQMAAQAFRIEKTLWDLRWNSGKKTLPLDPREITAIRELLHSPKALSVGGEITFKKIYQHLSKKPGYPDRTGMKLNLETEERNTLLGNRTLARFKWLGLLDKWLALQERTQIQIINFLADLGSPEQLDKTQWHTSNEEFIGFINKLREHDRFDRLSKMKFDAGRGSYSIKAMKRLTDWLQNPSWSDDDSDFRIDEDAAIRQCYPDYFLPPKKTEKLLPAQRTYNDVVDGALRQVRMIINRCIDIHGKPAEIILESGRELGAGAKKRKEWEKLANDNRKKRQAAAKEIEEHGKTATQTAIDRYRLYTEQCYCCPYCGKSLSLEAALDGAQSEFEHILPRSLTQVGKKRSEMVLSHKNCNHEKGNRTPYEAFHDTERWEHIERFAERLEAKAKGTKGQKSEKHYYRRKAGLLRLKDYESDESIDGFADRQMHQTSWITKAAGKWLHSICDKVFVSKGQMTGNLRAAWGLNTIIPEVRFEEGYDVLDTEGKKNNKRGVPAFSGAMGGKGSAKP